MNVKPQFWFEMCDSCKLAAKVWKVWSSMLLLWMYLRQHNEALKILYQPTLSDLMPSPVYEYWDQPVHHYAK